MQLRLGSAPASGAVDDALVVGLHVCASEPFGALPREVFGAEARRTAAEAAALPFIGELNRYV